MDPEMVGNVHPVWDPREGRVTDFCAWPEGHLCGLLGHVYSSRCFQAIRLLESEMLLYWIFKEIKSVFPHHNWVT